VSIIICHRYHENDLSYRENLFEYFANIGIEHDFVELPLRAHSKATLRRYLSQGHRVSLLGFNSQIDHTWLDDEPLPLFAKRHGATVMQWFFDHPSVRWPEFNYSDRVTSRFVFHSSYSQVYFDKFCCPGAVTTTAGSIGPNWRSRSMTNGSDAFLARPLSCLIPLNLERLGKTFRETEEEIAGLAQPLPTVIKEAVIQARADLDGPLETHLSTALAGRGIVVDPVTFNRYFRLVNDATQYWRRSFIFKIARRFDVRIQSDATAGALMEGGRARVRQDVSSTETLVSLPLYRAVLNVCPVNDSIHDRTCNALNAGCVPILEDNRAHRHLFRHGSNSLLFRYNDESLAECLGLVCNDPQAVYSIAQQAKLMRDESPFRFGAFSNIVALTAQPQP
jgi:hypothetical protein